MKAVYLILLCFVSITGCVTYNISENYMQGQWTSDNNESGNVVAYAGNTITIQYSNDSFYYSINRWTGYSTNDPCQADQGTEFASGTYSIKGNLLKLQGNWTDKTFRNIKCTGCFNNGKLEITYVCTILDEIKLEYVFLYVGPKYGNGFTEKMVLYKK